MNIDCVILLDKLFIPAIFNSTGLSLWDCLHDIPAKRQAVRVDDAGIIMDIDTAEEYKAVAGRYNRP